MSEHHGKIWWSELMTRDPAAAKAYYEATCGWEVSVEEMPQGPYWLAKRGEEMVAGFMDMTGLPGMEDVPPHWLTYVAVSDVDSAAEATQAAGGTVIRPPFDVPGVGRIAIINDPTGAALGIMTPAPQG